ncbi:MAG: apolipoprotein N-acyltransferase [Desulfobacterales bacterium]|nr:apolipoprotein N-acyltransferase [Desulfobacterales bacterium]
MGAKAKAALEVATTHDFFWAGLTALLLTLSFPTPDVGWLAWVSLVPLSHRALDLAPKRAFRLGWVAGFFHFFALVFWVVFTLHQYGSMPLIAGVSALVLLSLYLGLYLGAFAWFLARWQKGMIWLVLVGPFFWVGLEYLRTYFLTGFPWGLLGYTQHRFFSLIQICDLVGVYGVSFLVVMGNLCLAFFCRWGSFCRAERRAVLAVALLCVGLISGAVVYGHQRLRGMGTLMAEANTLSVGVLQGNIDQSVKWDAAFRDATLNVYERLAREALGEDPDLLVLPETALPFYYLRERIPTQRVNRMMASGRADWIAGAPAAEPNGDSWRFYNRAYAMAPNGELMGSYDKVHLVPFGEYVPLQGVLFFIKKLVVSAGNFSPGKKGGIIEGGRGRKSWKAGGQICFESIFPGLSVASARSGATFLVNLTNDAWFGRTGAPYQHLQMARFRAIETRRSLVRSANTGISGFVLPTGEVRKTTGLFEDAWQVETVPLMTIASFYVRFGDLFAWFCCGLILVFAVWEGVIKGPLRSAFS